jgi:hypothetical protein
VARMLKMRRRKTATIAGVRPDEHCTVAVLESCGHLTVGLKLRQNARCERRLLR